MRCVALFCGLLASCAAPDVPSFVPIEVVGDGERIVGLWEFGEVDDLTRCLRAADDEEWRQLCATAGMRMPDVALGWAQRILVPMPGAMDLRGIVISSEEGVDVITLDVTGGSVHSTAPARHACLLHVASRECQIAVVLRDQERGEERTVAVFPGP